jgi:hypothetical protein
VSLAHTLEYFDDYERMVFLCLVAQNFLAIDGLCGKIKKRYLNYSVNTGEDPSIRTELQQHTKNELQRSCDPMFYQGQLYSGKCKLKYDPTKVLRLSKELPVLPILFKDTLWNDCLIFAVNFMLRCHFFRFREQVVRLAAES